MAWITPRTWIKGDFPTVGRMNVDLRDNMLFLGTCIGSRVRPSTTQSVPNNTATVLTYWDTEDWDADTIHGTPAARLTINTAGKYLIGSAISIGIGGATTARRISLQVWRATVMTELQRVQERGMTPEVSVLYLETVYDCLVADYFQIETLQDSGGAANYAPSLQSVEFFCHRICN